MITVLLRYYTGGPTHVIPAHHRMRTGLSDVSLPPHLGRRSQDRQGRFHAHGTESTSYNRPFPDLDL